MACAPSLNHSGATLPYTSYAVTVNETDDPTVEREKPELKDVDERAALGLLDLTESVKGLGTIALAKPNAILVGIVWETMDSEETSNETLGYSTSEAMYSM
jgi:hypothetical protein